PSTPAARHRAAPAQDRPGRAPQPGRVARVSCDTCRDTHGRLPAAASCGCRRSGTRGRVRAGRARAPRMHRAACSGRAPHGPTRARTPRASAVSNRRRRAPRAADRYPRSVRAIRRLAGGRGGSSRPRSSGNRCAAGRSAKARTDRRSAGRSPFPCRLMERLSAAGAAAPHSSAAASKDVAPAGEAGAPTHALAVLILAVAELPLGELATLLRLDAQRRDRPRFEPAQADLVAGLLAVAVRAVLDPLQRSVDLLQELPLAIASAQLQSELRLLSRAVVRIGEVRRLVLHVEHRAVDFFHQLALPGEQDLPEVLSLPLAHVRLATLRLIRLEAAQRSVQDAAEAPRLARRGRGGLRSRSSS